MKLQTKREYLRDLALEKNRWSRPFTDEEKVFGFLGWHERGHLPHCDFPGLVQFVTFRLADSMPISRRGEWEHLLKIEDDREKRTKLEEYLDRGVGECHLNDPRIAKLAEKALLFFHNQRYELLAWCVMPNHVHVLVHVWQTPLSKIVQSWKRYVATHAETHRSERRSPTRLVSENNTNAPARRAALQWQREYWDTFMRNEAQEKTAIRYIENNPVKAMLSTTKEQWPFSSARFWDELRHWQFHSERRPLARLVDNTNRNTPCWKPMLRPRCVCSPQSRMLRSVIHKVHEIAAEVIRQTGRDKPADAALREVLKQIKDLAPFDATEIARTVFIYYRWHIWLRDERGVESKMRLALRLDERFRANEANVPLAELRAKAVPAWTAEVMDVTDDWLRSLQQQPKLWLRAKHRTASALAEKLRLAGTPAPPGFSDALLYDGEEDLFKTPEFHAGEFEIQDIASQMVGLLCDPKPGETWWDTCAGEGGKTLHLSDLMQNKGLIWASDRAEWRLTKLKRRTGRAKVFNYRSAFWDGGTKLPTKTKFDGVLVDAPCSGVGTWQRNPQARWTTTPNDVLELSEIQRKLLANVAPSVKPGGKLIFSVCTLTRAETTEVVDDFDAKFAAEFEPLMLPAIISGGQPTAATILIWPQDLGGNGMFIAGWRRKKIV